MSNLTICGPPCYIWKRQARYEKTVYAFLTRHEHCVFDFHLPASPAGSPAGFAFRSVLKYTPVDGRQVCVALAGVQESLSALKSPTEPISSDPALPITLVPGLHAR
jgi:hypothetical protein